MRIIKTITLTKDDYYKRHLHIINPMLPKNLTPKEIDVLAGFMALNGTISNDRFGTTARKMVIEQLSLSLPGLANHLRSLRNKGFIKDDIILPILFPHNESQEYEFKLINAD